ncbi:MAG: single-stranded DNA-binding protein [Bacteroidales bacterium]|nr:single-stranded DNA-binding protein [Bacteroidales bacterium]
MAGLNKVFLIGRIGKDPEIHVFDDGTKKISFSLATTESYRDRTTNEWKDQTEWHNVVGYRYLAEKAIGKGDLIYVEGKIKNRKYSDKDGNDKYITEILSEKINILARPQGSDQQGTYERKSTPENIPNEPKGSDQGMGETYEDDLPF